MGTTITRGVTATAQQAAGRSGAATESVAGEFGCALGEAAAAFAASAPARPAQKPAAADPAGLAAQLSASLQNAYAGAGLAAQPAVELGFDRGGALQPRGDRADLVRIERVLNADPELARQAAQLRDLAGASRARRFAEQAATAEASAQTPAEADAAHRKFIYLMENAAATVTLSFDGAVRVTELPV